MSTAAEVCKSPDFFASSFCFLRAAGLGWKPSASAALPEVFGVAAEPEGPAAGEPDDEGMALL